MLVASYPHLSHNKTTAVPFYYDKSTSSIDICRPNSTTYSGLHMVQDSDMNGLGPVLLENAVGTARMFFRAGQLLWANDRFGAWVICEAFSHPPSGLPGWWGPQEPHPHPRYQLMWWDVITNQGIDTDWCAKVQLIAEKIAGNGC